MGSWKTSLVAVLFVALTVLVFTMFELVAENRRLIDRLQTIERQQLERNKRAEHSTALFPRFRTAYVQLGLRDYTESTGGEHAKLVVVDNPIARRIRLNSPPVDRDFGALAAPAGMDWFRRAYVAGSARRARTSIAGLLVTQITPGSVDEVRLAVTRRRLAPYVGIWDLSDLRWAARGPGRVGDFISWKPRSRSQAAGTAYFVPLALSHLLDIPRRPDGQAREWLLDDVIFLPRKLVIQRGSTRQTADLHGVLKQPVDLELRPGGLQIRAEDG